MVELVVGAEVVEVRVEEVRAVEVKEVAVRVEAVMAEEKVVVVKPNSVYSHHHPNEYSRQYGRETHTPREVER